MKALNKTCLAPVGTVIWSGVKTRSLSRLNLSEIAALRVGVPSRAVYLMPPSQMARAAASLI